MQHSSATPKKQDEGIELQKIVACSHSSSQCLLVSTVFNDFLYLFFYAGLAVTVYNIIVARGAGELEHGRKRMRIVRELQRK